jgi:hypothetical protein
MRRDPRAPAAAERDGPAPAGYHHYTIEGKQKISNFKD